MPIQSQYSIGDFVYLKESAAIGLLEAYRIDKIEIDANSNIIYHLDTAVRPPDAIRTTGDAVGYGIGSTIPVGVSEIIDMCDAVDLAITYHTAVLNKLNNIKNSNCDE